MQSSDTTPSTQSNNIPAGEKSKTPSRQAIIFLMVTAFLSTMGFGIFSPVLPFIVQRYVSDQNNLATAVGWLASVYAICQFIAAPGLGILSDRYGRRPLLLLCLLGSAIGYGPFGLGGTIWVLFLGRIIDGLTGGNFSILFAYVADITEPEERGKYFGLFGGVAGVGIIIGPVIGGFASKLGYQAPIYIAAAITLANVIWGYFNLPESLSQEHRLANISLGELNPFKQLRNVFALPQLLWLLLVGFFYAFPFAALQSNSAVLVKDSLGWSPDSIGMVFLAVGTVDILVQGVLVSRLLPILGEIKLTLGGLICVIIGYLLISSIAFVPSAILLLAGIVLFAGGGGLIEPALRGLTSEAAGPREQGVVQGGSQSIQSLALILGPLWGALLYTQLGHASPYWSGAALAVLAILLVFLAIPSIRAHRSQK